MRKYILAFLITIPIPIMLFVRDMGDTAEETPITFNSSIEESANKQTDILSEPYDKGMIVPEETEATDEESDIVSADNDKNFYKVSDMKNGQGSIEQIGDEEYRVTLYDKNHNEVFSEDYSYMRMPPWFTMITDNIWEIGISVGSPARYTFYFDTETAEISDVYFNAKVFGDKYIAYMDFDAISEDEITLTLTDIFDKGILHQEVMRDFTVCADPMSAILSVEMIDDANIRLEYWEGADYTYVTETIELEWDLVLLTRIIKEHLQNNDFSGYTFQESEKALCYYMGINNNFPNMYVFAICKEALNGDIVHERTVYIAKETGHLYAKDNGALVELNVDVPKGMQLPDVTRNSAWNWEPELVYSEDGTSFHYAYGEEGEKVLEQITDFVKREGVSGDWGVLYYGECTHFYRRYHEVHLVEEHDTHVITLKRYYIDALNGNVYEEPYESFIGMDSDVVLHFVGNIEIGEEHGQGILYEHTLLGKMWFYYSADEIPYVDEETFELIRHAYDEVDYSVEFEKGNPEMYEEYKQKFRGLIQNEVPFLDKETGRELYIKDWMELHGLIVPEDFKAPYIYIGIIFSFGKILVAGVTNRVLRYRVADMENVEKENTDTADAKAMCL